MKIIKSCFIYICLLNTSIFGSNIKSPESVQKYFSLASEAFEKNEWLKVIDNCSVIIKKYPDGVFSKNALFYLGVAYFNLKDYELSNRYFTRYLKDDFNPKYFEAAMHYKFSIAQNFQKGAKKRLFNWKSGPKIIVAEEDALAIYDEIISSMPMHDLTAKSLFAKGQLLFNFEEYKDSISTFEQLIERFEKHELAIESFIEISKIYLKKTTYKKQDPNILDLAELNLRNLKKSFPSAEEKIKELENIVLQIKEKFAVGFLEVAQFYEKTKKKEAAIIYYSKIINSFPESSASKVAQKRIDKLNEN